MKEVKKAEFFIFIFFLSLYSLFSIGHFWGDGYEDYLTAESIVLDRNITLFDRPGDIDELRYKMEVGGKTREGESVSGRGNLGLAVLLAAFYAKGHIFSLIFQQVPHDFITMFFVSFYNPLILAASALLVFVISGRLGFRPRIGAVISLIYGLATMVPVYARTGFAEPTLLFLLLLTTYLLIVFSQGSGMWSLISASLAIAYMVFTKSVGVVFIPAFLLYVVWVSLSRGENLTSKIKPISIFSVLLSLFIFLVLLSNFSIYGKWLNFSNYHLGEGAERILKAPHFLKGIYYYLMSSGKGFFFYNIPLILSLFVLRKALQERKRETILFLLIIMINVLLYAKSFRRGSLFSWGPRYLLPSVPFLALLIGYYIERYKNAAAKVLLTLSALIGFFIMLPCMFINQSKFYFFVVEKLNLQEYMVNFIPDLSPIKGAWCMFASRIVETFGGSPLAFIYDPDYRLVSSVGAIMSDYNYFDIWFLKVIEVVPGLLPAVCIVLFLLSAVSVFSLYKIFAAK